jgi:hypothetical protein
MDINLTNFVTVLDLNDPRIINSDQMNMTKRHGIILIICKTVYTTLNCEKSFKKGQQLAK